MVGIKKILCPVDFSPASERAVAYAAVLARNFGAKLRLLNVVTPMIPTAYEFPLNMVAVIETMQDDSKNELKKLLDKLKISGLDVETESTVGDIFTKLLNAIEVYKPDLLAMGTHGRRGFQRWILGSTTERMLRHSPVPVLTISAAKTSWAPGKPIRRILVTTDLSEATVDALKYALSIAQENHAEVTVLHVLDEVRAITSKKFRDTIAKDVERQCAKLVPASAEGACDIDVRIEAGTPYHVILSVVHQDKIDLLVMNTHGKGMFDRVLLGSTTERVVRGAMCPVLLIPPKAKSAKKRHSKKIAG